MQEPATTPADRARMTPEQHALFARFRGGDREAFHGLLRPHLGSLLALARRLTGDPHWAEDLVQETLVRAYRGLGEFRGEAALRTWLFRILVRLAAEPSRWRRQERTRSLADLEIPDTMSAGPEAPAIDRELRDRLMEAMERLPPRQRAALHLRAVEGMDYRAIAESLGCSNQAARMLVLEARRKTMERIGRHLLP